MHKSNRGARGTYQTGDVSTRTDYWRDRAKAYQVDHVRGEEGNAVLLEELLVFLDHAIEPGEELLGAVVGVDCRKVSA